MQSFARALVIGAVALIATTGPTAVANAAPPVTPFQIAPAPYGNPNGSVDTPAIHCGVVRDGRGVITVTGTERDRWGCIPYATVNWVNVSTGRTGSARLSAGLHGRVPQARLTTGRGQVALTLTTSGGIITPGFTTVAAH